MESSFLPHCSEGTDATRVCCRPECHHPAFVCDAPECRCEKEHELCSFIQVIALRKRLLLRKSESDNMMCEVTHFFDKMIKEINRVRDGVFEATQYAALSHQEEVLWKEV